MNERSILALLALPLALAVTSLVGTGQAPANSKKTVEAPFEAASEKPATQTSRRLKTACDVLEDYLAIRVPAKPSRELESFSISGTRSKVKLAIEGKISDENACDIAAVRKAIVKERIGLGAGFVFIPDPNASSLALAADRYLDAIRSALGREGYVPYRTNNLPWKAAHSREKEQKSAEMKDADVSADLPGLWLFRRQGDLKLLFLIGDSPTVGVSKPQFHNAVSQFSELFEKSLLAGTLRLVGPVYSGSVDSLGHALRQLPQAPNHPGKWLVRAASGTAEVPDLETKLAATAGESVDVRLEQLAKRAAQEKLLSFLTGMGKTAILSESDTVFGQASVSGAGGDTEIFHYSRDIQSLRSAYEADQDLMSHIFPRSTRWTDQLALHLSSRQDPTDALPVYDPDNLAVSHQNTLRHLASSLQRRLFRNLLIVASDTLDSIFLTRFFQEENSNLRIAILDSDTLLDRHAEAVSLRGVITISQQPTGSVAMQAVEFPDGQTFGVYRACRRMLFDEMDCQSPNRVISVVGYGGEWPLRILGPVLDDPNEVSNWLEVFRFRWWGPTLAFGLLLLWFTLTPTLIPYLTRTFPWLPKSDIFRFVPFCRSICHLPTSKRARRPWQLNDSEPSRRKWLRYCVGTGLVALLLPVLLALAAIVLPAKSWEYPALVARYFYFANGVSPLLPLTALLLATHACAWSRVRGCYLQAYTFRPAPFPLPISGRGGKEIEHLLRDVRERGEKFFHPWAIGGFMAFGAIAVFTYDIRIRDVEIELGHKWSMFFWTFLFASVGILIFHAASRFWMLWVSLHRLLRRLEFHPLRLGFTTLPERVSWTSIWSFSGTRPTMVSLQMSSDYLNAIDRSRYGTLSRRIDDFMESVHDGDCHLSPDSYWRLRWLQYRTEKVAARFIDDLSAANGAWAALRIEGWKPSEPGASSRKEDPKPIFPLKISPVARDGSRSLAPEPDPDRNIAKLKAEFIALQYAAFIRYAFMQLRNILGFLGTATTLFFIALNVYPFQPIGTLTNCATFLFAVCSIVVVAAFYQMDRNPLLSRLSNTNAGKLDAGFGWRLLQFGALPTVTFLATHFPPIGQALVKVVQIIPGLAKL